VDKAREMGIDWWANDPYLSSRALVAAQAISGNIEPAPASDEVEEDSSKIIEKIEQKEPIIKRPKYRV
jgi:aconitase A